MALTEDVSSGESLMRFLLINGESFEMRFPQSATIREVKQKVIDDKPSELTKFWQQSTPSGPAPIRTDDIRILHLGKFLEDSKTLQECSIPHGPDAKPTVHVSCRVPSSVVDDSKGKFDKKGGSCCVIV